MPSRDRRSTTSSSYVNANRQDAFEALTGERPPSDMLTPGHSRRHTRSHAGSRYSARPPPLPSHAGSSSRSCYSYLDDAESLCPNDSISQVAPRRMRAEASAPSQRSSIRESSRTSSTPHDNSYRSSSSSQYGPFGLRQHMDNYCSSDDSDAETSTHQSFYTPEYSYPSSSTHINSRTRSHSRPSSVYSKSYHTQAPSNSGTTSHRTRSTSTSHHNSHTDSSSTSHSKSRAYPPTSYRTAPEPAPEARRRSYSNASSSAYTPSGTYSYSSSSTSRQPSHLTRSTSRSNASTSASSHHHPNSTIHPRPKSQSQYSYSSSNYSSSSDDDPEFYERNYNPHPKPLARNSDSDSDSDDYNYFKDHPRSRPRSWINSPNNPPPRRVSQAKRPKEWMLKSMLYAAGVPSGSEYGQKVMRNAR